MTYCLGIKVKDGLVAISDTRITSGTDTTVKKKVSIHQKGDASFFIMTSGLRSVRDKAILYFKELIEQEEYNKLYKAVNAFGTQVKRVADEDRISLQQSGFKFDLNTIIGGQLKDDEEHKLFMLYPEGNWVELGQGAPFVVIKNSATDKEQLITPVEVITMPYDDLLRKWKDEGTQLNKLMAVGTEPNIRNLQAKLNAEFSDTINAYTSKPTYLEIMPKNASKAEAARFLLDMYHIPREESIALGDNFNDKEMLVFAGKGIAMGNAPAEIKAIADDITDTNQHDGVRKALEKWVETR